jgi:hypothetical protein
MTEPPQGRTYRRWQRRILLLLFLAITINILDHSPLGSVTVAANNVVSVNDAPNNTANDSFAIQLLGTFSGISFETNSNLLSSQSVGFSIAADEANVGRPVPEPGIVALVGLALSALGLARRKRA